MILNIINLYVYSLSSHLGRFEIISSERFRVHGHIFSEAGLLLKYLGPYLGCRLVDIFQKNDSLKKGRDILTRD